VSKCEARCSRWIWPNQAAEEWFGQRSAGLDLACGELELDLVAVIIWLMTWPLGAAMVVAQVVMDLAGSCGGL
jgi:hypothetical protein